MQVNKVICGYSTSVIDDIVFLSFFNLGADRVFSTIADITLELENQQGQVLVSKDFSVVGKFIGSVDLESDVEKGVEGSTSDFFSKLKPTVEKNIHRYFSVYLDDL